jgi:hypothetical protein
MLVKDFNASLMDKVNPPQNKFVDIFSVEYLYNFNNTDHILSDPENHFSGLPYGYQLITLDFSNLNMMLQHVISPGITLKHAYTYLNKTNYYYYDDSLSRFGVEGLKVVQNQYYMNPAFTTQNGFTISPSVHLLRIKYQVPFAVSGGGGPGFGGGNNIQLNDHIAYQFAGGINLSQYVGRFGLRLGGIYSSLNDASQLTGTAGLTWYPTGNLDLYLGSSLNVHSEFKDQKTGVELIPDFMLGFGISSKVWMEFSGAFGNMKNYTEGNGYIIYNGLDWMKYKVTGSIIIPVTNLGSMVYLGARFAECESRFIPFDPLAEQNKNIIIYNSVSIYGGLSWKF